MNIPCAKFSPCPDVYPPYTNLSSEDPDRYVCIGRSWGNYQSPPRIGSAWTEANCYQTCDLTLSDIDLIQCRALGKDMCSGECVQSVSTELADICAANASAAECNPDPHCVYNMPQSCTVTCPDGTGFTYTAPAGLFCETSQALADAKAYSFACNQANSLKQCTTPITPGKLCLSDLSTGCTTDDSITLNLSAYGSGFSTFSVIWTLESGSLPPGLILDTATHGVATTISGIPTTPGVYTFTVKVQSLTGAFCERTYIVEVLSPMTEGTKYKLTLAAPACGSGKHNRTMTGSLNDGLNWSEDANANDFITGTPSTAGTCVFMITYA